MIRKLKIKQTKGFTLIELTIVLFIVGLLLAGLLVPLREGVEQERRADTLENLKEIEDSLYGFSIANGRLPCPDCRAGGIGNCPGAGNTVNDGVEDLIGNACAVDPNAGAGDILEGNIPWVTLGVSQFDAWDSWFTYSVVDYVADVVPSGTPGNPDLNCVVFGENLTTIDMCAVGSYTIVNRAAACPAPAPPQVTEAQNIFAVVVSHGANITRIAVPAGTALIDAPVLCSEIENLDQDNIFVSSPFQNPNNNANPLGIDDMIIWISPHVLKSKLIQAGRLP